MRRDHRCRDRLGRVVLVGAFCVPGVYPGPRFARGHVHRDHAGGVLACLRVRGDHGGRTVRGSTMISWERIAIRTVLVIVLVVLVEFAAVVLWRCARAWGLVG